MNKILLFILNFINPILFHKIPHGIAKVAQIKSVVAQISVIPSFAHFLRQIYLIYSIIAWLGINRVFRYG